MKETIDADLSELIEALTHAYHQLGELSDRLHRPFGITTGIRSILLLLAKGPPLTLSEIADERGVSRQFIQKIARPLIAKGLIAVEANPRHKRSAKLRLTGWGGRVVEQIRAREAGAFERVGSKIDMTSVAPALAALDAINVALADEMLPKAE